MEIFTRNPVRLFLLIAAAVAALALSACGGDDDGGTSSGPDPATLAPADTPLYFEAAIKPEGDTKDNLISTLNKLLNTDDSGSMITEEINSAFESDGISYSDDIEPWLGSTMGAWLTSFSEDSGEGAAAFAVTDTGEAADGLDKLAASDDVEGEEREYEGTSYTYEGDGSDTGMAYGIVGDFVVIGTEEGFKQAVDAEGGDSLADSDTASSALEDVQDNSIFEGYVDVQAAVDAALQGGVITQKDLDQSGASDQLDQLGDEPVVFSGAAGSDNLSFEATGPATADAMTTDIVSTLPGDAWLAFGAADVGGAIAQSYDQFVTGFQSSIESNLDQFGAAGISPNQIPDINAEIKKATGLDISKDFGWIGNMGGFVSGGSIFDLGGGIVIETDDPDQAAATLAKLRKALGRERSLKITPTEGGGFNITSVDAPVGAEIGIRDDKVVFAFAGATIDDVLEPQEPLSDSDRFGTATDALGDGLDATFFLDMPTVVSLIEGSGATSDPDYQSAAPYIGALDYMVAGSGNVDDRTVARFVLGVKESSGDSGSEAAIITP